jgi:hypothetical protein
VHRLELTSQCIVPHERLQGHRREDVYTYFYSSHGNKTCSKRHRRDVKCKLTRITKIYPQIFVQTYFWEQPNDVTIEAVVETRRPRPAILSPVTFSASGRQLGALFKDSHVKHKQYFIVSTQMNNHTTHKELHMHEF